MRSKKEFEDKSEHVFSRAKKSLGQNFLKSETALRKIVEAGEVKNTDTILEIGPGKGALTKKLLEKAKRVIAIEKDKDLFEFLKIEFKKEIEKASLVLVYEDILEFDPKKFQLEKYKIIANIPYNITGAILKKFLTEKQQPESMVLMVQHEVAKRIVARDNKESILSISVKAYGEPKMIMKVEARYFSPKPKVDSAVIAINNISRQIFEKNKINEGKFWEIVKTGFAHKRKILGSNLKSMFKKDNTREDPIFGNLPNKRAEDLSLKDWIDLAKI